MSALFERVPITVPKLKEWHDAVDEQLPDVGRMDEVLRSYDLTTQAAIVGFALAQFVVPITPEPGGNACYAAWVVMLENVNRRTRAPISPAFDPPGLRRTTVRRGDYRRRR